MTKRLLTVVLAVVATLGIAAAPAQAKVLSVGSVSVSELAKPLGWEWGV